MTTPAPLVQRLTARMIRSGETDCWLWQGTINAAGYGTFQGIKVKEPGRTRLAHRLMYEECIGPVPDGMQLDHLCRVRACVNPSHLEPVTLQENLRRGQNGVLRMFCNSGRHPWIAANQKPSGGGKHVTCRACANERWNAAYARRREGGQ